jgi:hypothetical protein
MQQGNIFKEVMAGVAQTNAGINQQRLELAQNEARRKEEQGKKLTPAEVHEATEMVMRRITELVSQLRGTVAPQELWDPANHGQAEHGNFKKNNKKAKN